MGGYWIDLTGGKETQFDVETCVGDWILCVCVEGGGGFSGLRRRGIFPLSGLCKTLAGRKTAGSTTQHCKYKFENL